MVLKRGSDGRSMVLFSTFVISFDMQQCAVHVATQCQLSTATIYVPVYYIRYQGLFLFFFFDDRLMRRAKIAFFAPAVCPLRALPVNMYVVARRPLYFLFSTKDRDVRTWRARGRFVVSSLHGDLCIFCCRQKIATFVRGALGQVCRIMYKL